MKILKYFYKLYFEKKSVSSQEMIIFRKLCNVPLNEKYGSESYLHTITKNLE